MSKSLDNAKRMVEAAAKAAQGDIVWKLVGKEYLSGQFVFTLSRPNGLAHVFKLGVSLGEDRFYGELARFSVQTWSSQFPQYKVTNAYKVFARRYVEGQRLVGLRPKRGAVPAPIKDVSREAISRGHDNACAVLALSAVAGCSFEDADAFWKVYGARRHNRDGTYTAKGLNAADPLGSRSGIYQLELLGVEFVRMKDVRGATVKRLVRRLNSESDKSPVFVQVRGHCLAFVNGELHDTKSDSGLSRVQSAFRVVKLAQK